MDIIDTEVAETTIVGAISPPAVDVATYHRAVEALRIRDDLETARIDAAEFRIRLDGANAALKQVTAERDRARSDLEQLRSELERVRSDQTVAKTQATERAVQVDLATARAEHAEEALRETHQLRADQSQASVGLSAPSSDTGLVRHQGDGSQGGNVFARMLQELRRLA